MKAEDIKLGMKIKFAMPTVWCEVIDKSPYIWFKGRIIECHEKAIVVSGKNRKHKIYLDRIMCFLKNGEYRLVKKQK
jgi:hypothetical protein